MRPGFFSVFVLTMILLFNSCIKKESTDNIDIFAASGSRLASDEICNIFEKITRFKVNRNYTSSGILARQIANGADCDIYISANKQWIDYLTEKDFLKKDSIKKIAANSIVVITPVNSEMSPLEFTKDFDILSSINRRIVIGDPGYVPVGKYTKQAFESIGWYESLQNKMIMAKDVTAALRYVELGECDWGVVYYSEALKSSKIKIVQTIPESLHNPIVFYIADIKKQKAHAHFLSEKFYSEEGSKIFKQHGFTIEED